MKKRVVEGVADGTLCVRGGGGCCDGYMMPATYTERGSERKFNKKKRRRGKISHTFINNFIENIFFLFFLFLIFFIFSSKILTRKCKFYLEILYGFSSFFIFFYM